MNNLKINNEEQKTAIVTGASEGIGAAFSKLLIKKGWKVFGISRSSSKLRAISNSFQSNKQSFKYFSCDVQDLKNWKVQNEITTAPVWGGSRELLVHDVIDTEDGFYMTALPTFYFINEDMRIVSMQEGFSSEIIEQHVEEMLYE